MNDKLKGKKVAILATDGFEQSELLQPKRMLEEAGAITTVVSPNGGQIKGWNEKNWGDSVLVDKPLDQCRADDFGSQLTSTRWLAPGTTASRESGIELTADG